MMLSAKRHHGVKCILQHSIWSRSIIHSRNLATSSTNATSSSLPQRLIPKLNQSVTRLGFGGYRVSDPATHGAALQYALKNGINLIDTGANFENGRSEKMIGDTLASANVDRKEITLVTKAGYLTNKDIERLDQLGNTGAGGDDYVHIQGNSYHGISPRILEDQLAQSLARLQTNYIDIFMINAPERMLLSSSAYRSGDVYKQLAASFRFLDDMVQQGTIRGYGVCSNTMASKEAVDHISLASVLAACESDTNFCAVEAPFNLYEQQLVHDAAWMDTLETNGIFWLANRPLNAITPQGSIRGLYNHMLAQPKDMDDLRQAFERVAELEIDMISELPDEDEDDEQEGGGGGGGGMASRFVWGQILSENLQRLGQHHFATQHYLRSQVQPKLDKDLDDFKMTYGHVPAYMEWTEVYRASMLHLMECLVNYSYMDTLKKNNDLDRILSALVAWPNQHVQPTEDEGDSDGGGGLKKAHCHSPLTVKALQIYLAQQDVGAVVTGMRQPQYVDDALLAMKEYQASPLTEHHLMDINRILV